MGLAVTERAQRVEVTMTTVEAVGADQPLVHDSCPLIIVGGKVDGRRCDDVLVDGGASSNFVRRSWAKQQRLRVRPLSHPIEVTLANGVSIRIAEAVRVKSLNVVGSTAGGVLLVLDSLSHDVVLGLPWLQSAQVTIDFGQGTWNGLPVHMVSADPVNSGGSTPRLSQLSQLQLSGMKISLEHQSRMEAILAKVGSVFSTELPRGGAAKTGRAVQCEVTLRDSTCQPAADQERRRSQRDIDTLIAATKEMEQAGLIRPSKSEWRAQAVLVKKFRDGVELPERRPCWDYRGLNLLVRKDSFPLPLTDDLTDKLTGSVVFSKIDLLKGFWQIPMDEKSKHLLAFSTPIGLYEPNYMPFGYKNAPAVFQREMQRVLRDRLMKGVLVFIDDILIYSKTVEEHGEMVEWVLTRLRDEGYLAHPDKCEFFQREVSFLGHIVNVDGLSVQPHKVKSVQDWPIPTCTKHVRGFLGFTGYYRRFIQDYGKVAIPLTNLLQKDVQFRWGSVEQTAFDELKGLLTRAPVLAHPDPDRQFILHTDASGYAVSGVLSQKQDDGRVRPLAFISHKMTDAERNYSTFDQELLAIVTCLKIWKAYLTGTREKVLVYTDHLALKWITTCKELTGRPARWALELCEADFDVHHVPGDQNGAADALSRRPDHHPEYRLTEQQAQWMMQQGVTDVKVSQLPPKRTRKSTVNAAVTVDELADPSPVSTDSSPVRAEQGRKNGAGGVKIDVHLQGILAPPTPSAPNPTLSSAAVSSPVTPLLDELKAAAISDEWYAGKLKEEKPTDGLVREDGLLRFPVTGAVWVPADDGLRSQLLREIHDNGGHHGVNKTLHRLAQLCFWPGMRAQVGDYVLGCEKCARAKSSSLRPSGLLQPLPIPSRPWEVITLDFVGPLPLTKAGHSMVLGVSDKMSKQAHFIATEKTVTAEKTARLILQHVVKHHGLPTAIVSDRDPRFTSGLWKELWHGTGTELRMSSSYHPQTDGQSERTNRIMETGLRLYCNHTRTDWDECLHLVEAYYNSSVHESTGKTPYEMNGVVWTDATTLALRSPVTSHVRNQRAEDILTELKLVWAEARRAMMKAQERQKRNADVRRRDERYEVGDMVMLNLRDLGKSKGKLSDRWVGPFRVKELVGDNGLNVRLDLPSKYSRMAQTIHVEKLKRFTPSQHEWPGRVQQRGRLPAVEEEDGYFEVERVIGKRSTWEDVTVTPEVKQDDRLINPYAALSNEGKVEDESGGVDQVEEEVKVGDEPSRRVTRAMTRAGSAIDKGLQIVSVQVMRTRKAKVSRLTPNPSTEKREVVWYLVRWKGYGPEEDSWVREEDMNAPEAIREWEEAQRSGSDLGLHYLHCKAGENDTQLSTLVTRVVGDWSL